MAHSVPEKPGAHLHANFPVPTFKKRCTIVSGRAARRSAAEEKEKVLSYRALSALGAVLAQALGAVVHVLRAEPPGPVLGAATSELSGAYVAFSALRTI